MSTLIVVGYDEEFKAEEVRIQLQKLHREHLLDLEDAVVAFKDEKGRVKLDQAVNLTAKGAVSGGFWGALIGLIFLNPLFGMAIGAAAGAVDGRQFGNQFTQVRADQVALEPAGHVLGVVRDVGGV